jgi:hypothetical protein
VHRNPNADHRELWIRDPDGYTVVIASPDGDCRGAEDVCFEAGQRSPCTGRFWPLTTIVT